jgi:DNA-binding response OmpR family regulator
MAPAPRLVAPTVEITASFLAGERVERRKKTCGDRSCRGSFKGNVHQPGASPNPHEVSSENSSRRSFFERRRDGATLLQDAGNVVEHAADTSPADSSGSLCGVMRALVVEDDDVLGRAITRTLEQWGNTVTWCTTLQSALLAAAAAPDLVIIDVTLPDGSGVTLAQELSRQRPAPLVVAMSGQASASEAFQLGALGVRGYLPKPLSFTELTATIDSLLDAAPDLSPLLVASVGKRKFQDVQEQVRRTMTEQALALARGNRTEAAKLLGVTRQAVQQLIRNLDIPETPQKKRS